MKQTISMRHFAMRSGVLPAFLVLFTTTLTVPALCAPSEPPSSSVARASAMSQIGQPVELNISLPEIRSDNKVETLNLATVQAGKNLVLFFFSEQCGVTFRYKQRLQKLQKEYDAQGFTFIGVLCGKRENPDTPIDIAEPRYLKMPFVHDSSGVLARSFRIKQSLTFAVVDKTGKLRYRGGFDDNVEEKRVTKSYLRNALHALAAGKPVAVKEAGAIGCAIIPVF